MPTRTIKILLLEDKDQDVLTFNETATRLSESLDVIFNIKRYSKIITSNISEENIFEDILKNDYDFFIVDLKLKWDVDSDRTWNSFLETLMLSYLHTPVVINSSVLVDLDPRFNLAWNPLIKQFDPSSSSAEEILRHIYALYKSWINDVLWTNWTIEKTLNDLIWKWWLKNIKSWDWITNKDLAKKSLSRYILSHLHHMLSWDYDHFIPEEIYLSMNDWKYDTWTILKKWNDYFIILTPACDIAQDKPSKPKFMLYKLYKIITPLILGSLEEHNSFKSKSSKYWLERASMFDGGYIDYENSISIPKNTINEYEIICLVSSFFLKDIVFKLWNYCSRQGSPDLKI